MDTTTGLDPKNLHGLATITTPDASAPLVASSPAASLAVTQAGVGRWHESSWDLSNGLTVHEGLPHDAGLDEWLEAMSRN